MPQLPLSTRGRFIIDANGKRFKLAGVNWYGASDIFGVPGGLDKVPVEDIAHAIASMGFNSVRLPFSNMMLHQSQPVDPATVAANPDCIGKTPLEVYDRVVGALTGAGIIVIINNHTTHGMWCCGYDSDGLWYASDYSEDQWVDDWVMMARRYKSNPGVAAADLRNEVRTAQWNGTLIPNSPNWATSPNNWRAAAERAGNAILRQNPNILIVVEGINFPRYHLKGVAADPVRLMLPDKLVYSAHNYGFIGPDLNTGIKYGDMDWPAFKAKMEEEWGYVVTQNRSFTAPVWVSEFGEGYDQQNQQWFNNIVRYLKEKDIDFAYWAINPGPKPSGDGESFSLFEQDWKTPRSDWRVDLLKSIQAPATGPGIDPDYESNPSHHFDVLVFSDWDTNHSYYAQDWDPWAYKATCSEAMRAVGLSQGNRGGWAFSHALLCSDNGYAMSPGARRFVKNNGGDSQYAKVHTGSDWAGGYNKLECDRNEYVAGLSQTRNGLSYWTDGILCTASPAPLGNACYARSFDGGDSRGANYPDDWDSGAYKGQCGLDEYVAGISLKSGRPHSLLCCPK